MALKATGNTDPKLAHELRYQSNFKAVYDSTQAWLNTTWAGEAEQKLSLQTQFQVPLRLNEPLMLTLCMVLKKWLLATARRTKDGRQSGSAKCSGPRLNENHISTEKYALRGSV